MTWVRALTWEAHTHDKEGTMRRNFTIIGAAMAAVLVVWLGPGAVRATPASGFSGVTLAQGAFGQIEVFNHAIQSEASTARSRHHRKAWLSWQRTTGRSDLYVQNNTWQPGGSTGWHTHPGHSLIVVTAGEVTVYEGDDPSCTPHAYTVGMGFVDPGGDHVHNIRNEGAVEARTVAVQLIPSGAARRIDAPDPGNCGF
jgi:hypothetical protein